MGYAPERAAWKARRQDQYTRNKVTRALAEAGVENPEGFLLGREALAGASVFCGHQATAFLDDLFHRRLTLHPAGGQGFLRLSEVPR
ncbi:hypothetical protein [Streptomyces canus]|uniref:hypothetical protein n=1 Tax=Streptomyces TaxID=1883 RepID=UPI0036E099E4